MLFCYELFEYIWGFIVQYVELRFEDSIFRYLEDLAFLLECLMQFGIGSANM